MELIYGGFGTEVKRGVEIWRWEVNDGKVTDFGLRFIATPVKVEKLAVENTSR